MKQCTVTTPAAFVLATLGWHGAIACDVETKGTLGSGVLLGISLAPIGSDEGPDVIYVPFWAWDMQCQRLVRVAEASLEQHVGLYLSDKSLIGHNFTYDKAWIDNVFDIESMWLACTRLMYHLSDAPEGPKPYSLKGLQEEVLAWPINTKDAFTEHIQSRGGKIKNGDHYLASLEMMQEYGTMDAYSTLLGYKVMESWFTAHEYWPMLRKAMDYCELLERNTLAGVLVNVPKLTNMSKRLDCKRETAKAMLLKTLGPRITQLEHDWRDDRCARYQRDSAKQAFLNDPDRWEHFNLNSDKHKRALFYTQLGWPVLEKTEGGKPSTSLDTLQRAAKQALGPKSPLPGLLGKYEDANTLLTSFVSPWLGAIQGNRLHPRFNPCGTVSYRLSGFKPYLLNAPFGAKQVMACLTCDPGYIGLHADLAAIEPTITAHYSQDPSLLRVFGQGLGDIYLDLALTLFPSSQALHAGYNPNVPVTAAVKALFNKQRAIAKVIQLAVQYTGTEHTVQKNLVKAGFDVTLAEAQKYVGAYWRKFSRVAAFNAQLARLYRKEGHVRNVIGRIIQAPSWDYKDLPNRFIQSSAHDVLMLWVLHIYHLCEERGIPVRPIILDCHDSTSNQVPEAHLEGLRLAYKDAMDLVIAELQLSVNIRYEAKTFTTLAGLKS